MTTFNPPRSIAFALLLTLATTATASLQSEAERAVRAQGIELGDVGVAVLDPSTGQLLVDINASTPRIPDPASGNRRRPGGDRFRRPCLR